MEQLDVVAEISTPPLYHLAFLSGKLTMPNMLYHASPQGGIKVFEPRRESTPSIEQGLSPPRVYAADHPAYAAGHGFRWGTSEGFELGFVRDGAERDG